MHYISSFGTLSPVLTPGDKVKAKLRVPTAAIQQVTITHPGNALNFATEEYVIILLLRQGSRLNG